jgi:hypothetical protein
VRAERVGISEAVLITGLGARSLREIARRIPGACKELSATNTQVWRFDEQLLRDWVAGTVESVQDEARRKALSGRFPCEFYMRGPFMRAWQGHPDRCYFIGCESGHVKIGLAFKPKLRLRELQQGCPLQLTLLTDMPGSRAVEMYLHAFYAEERTRGEWFKQSERLMAYIEKLAR